MAKRTVNFNSVIDGKDVVVTADYYPAFAGTFYRRNGDPGDPPEPAIVENVKITDKTGKVVDFDSLSVADQAKLEEQVGLEATEPETEWIRVP